MLDLVNELFRLQPNLTQFVHKLMSSSEPLQIK